MKDQERSDKIKKILIPLLLIFTSCNFVLAEEIEEKYIDVTKDSEIRYKWYKKTMDENGDYYPMKDITDDDKVDKNKIKYIQNYDYSPAHCSLPKEYYLINKKYIRKYQTYMTSYLTIENISSSNDIKIYYNDELIDFEVINSNTNEVKINLKREYFCDKLKFEVNTDKKHKITLYADELFQKMVLSKETTETSELIPDKTWITEESEHTIYTTMDILKENDLTTLTLKYETCNYSEKYIYAYKSNKEYYDDNYYTNLNVDGYIKDDNDYKVFYKGEPLTITNTIEVIKEKIVKEPQIEYVYIEKKNDNIQNNIETKDPSKEIECLPETKIQTEIKTQYVEKEVTKIPKKIYFIILILIIAILLLTIKLLKKCRLK